MAGVAPWIKGLEWDERQTVSRAENPTMDIFQGAATAPRLTLISEPGLYKLISRSSGAEAKAFDRWVRHEVLPAIRQTGGYLLNEGMREPVDRQAP
jgi:anti-repressor protein